MAFSSLAGTVDSAGQGNYAAANAFLRRVDAAPPRPRAARRVGGVGPLGAGGMATDAGLRSSGCAAAGCRRWTRQWRSGAGPGDRPRPAERGGRRHRLAGLRPRVHRSPAELLSLARPARDALPAAPTGDGPRLARGPGRRRRAAPAGAGQLLLDALRALAAAVLGHDSPHAIGPAQAFRDLGFNSLMAVEFRNRLPRRDRAAAARPRWCSTTRPRGAGRPSWRRSCSGEGRRRPTTATATGPAGRADRDRRDELPAPRRRRQPGGAVAAGRRRACDGAVAPSPPTAAGRSTTAATTRATAAFVHDADRCSTPGLFGISPREALAMDPQQRLAAGGVPGRRSSRPGVDPLSLRGTPTGRLRAALIGLRLRRRLLDAARASTGTSLTGSAASVLSGRLAVRVRAGGPAVTVDTACSSSLVALHLAAQALQRGRVRRWRLAGGVTVMVDPERVRRVRPAGRPGRRRPVQGVRAPRPTAPGWAEGVGVLRAGAAVGRPAQRARGARGGPGQRGQPGRRVQRPRPPPTAPRSSG